MIREVSLRRFLSAPVRSALIVLGIALGVAMFVATEATTQTIVVAFEGVVARVAGRADLSIEGQGGVPNDLVGTVADMAGIAHAALSLEVATEATDLGQSLLVLGVDLLGDLHFLPFQVGEGETQTIEDPLAFVNDPKALLIGRPLAKRYGLEKGSKIRLKTADGLQPFVVRGVLEAEGPAASFGGQVAVMFLDAAQVSFGRGTFADRIDVAVEEGQDVDEVAKRLQSRLGPSYRVTAPGHMGDRLRDLTGPLRASLWVSGLIALLVSMFITYNAVGVSVAQRQKEIAILRALGATRARVTRMFCIEAVILAVPGTALGLLFARELAARTTQTSIDAIHAMYAAMPTIAPEITLPLVIQGSAGGIGMTALAAWWPARRGARVHPAAGLRSRVVAGDRATLPVVRFAIIGVLLMGLGWAASAVPSRGFAAVASLSNVLGAAFATPLLVVWLRKALAPLAERAFGISARLGFDYVERALERSAINVLALMVAVSLGVAIGGWMQSFQNSIRDWFEEAGAPDFTVVSGSPVVDTRQLRMDPVIIDQVAALLGIDAVQPYRFTDLDVGGVDIRLIATDTGMLIRQAEARGKGWNVTEGKTPLRPEDLHDKPVVVLSTNAATRLSKRPGETFALRSPSGPVDVTVRAVVVDYSSEKGAVFIDRSLYKDRWRDDSVDGMSVYATAGADVDAVAEAIRRLSSKGQSLFVTQTKDLKQHLIGLTSQTFAYSRSVEWITLVIALLGVVGTLVAAVLDRMREIGTLRAIGATRRQIAGAIVAEAAFLGFCAVLAGSVVGCLECLLLIRTFVAQVTGWHLDFAIPIATVGRVTLLVVATSALAALVPAWQASRLEVKEALSYE